MKFEYLAANSVDFGRVSSPSPRVLDGINWEQALPVALSLTLSSLLLQPTRLDRALPLGRAINPRAWFNLSELLFIVTCAR